MNSRRRLYDVAYQVRFAPWDSDIPAPELVEVIEGPPRLGPGRALDLGCGTGTHSVYLARHGWDVTGVDMAGSALGAARRKAADDGVSLRLIEGDVTRLDELGIGDGYTLLLDIGCYQILPSGRRDAYATGVTRVAAPGALLLMFGIAGTPVPGVGMTADELRRRFPGWQLVSATPVEHAELARRGWTALIATMLTKTHLKAWRYQLKRHATDGGGSSPPLDLCP